MSITCVSLCTFNTNISTGLRPSVDIFFTVNKRPRFFCLQRNLLVIEWWSAPTIRGFQIMLAYAFITAIIMFIDSLVCSRWVSFS